MECLFVFLALPKSNNLLHRSFDIAVSAIGICAFALPAIAIAITLKLKMGSPIILKQERIGLGGKSFMMLKFRSMTNDRDTDGELLPDALRVTPVGKWLRRWSIDEVPQFINIMCGDMSIIGPRPALAKKIERLRDAGHSEELEICLSVLPGLTGPMQVTQRKADIAHGQTLIDFDIKALRNDIRYVNARRQSAWVDARIFLKTFSAVARGNGTTYPLPPPNELSSR